MKNTVRNGLMCLLVGFSISAFSQGFEGGENTLDPAPSGGDNATCGVTYKCPDGKGIACSGSSNCKRDRKLKMVSCDGKEKYCPIA